MSLTLCGGGRAGAITLTNFAKPFGGIVSLTPESVVAVTQRIAGTFSHYGASFDANGTGRSIRWRTNSLNGNGLISPADSTAQVVYDNVSTDHLIVGDTRDIQYNGTAPAYIPWFFKTCFEADDGTHVGIYSTGGITIQNATFYAPLQGSANRAVETTIDCHMRTGGVASNMSVVVSTANTADTTVTFRHNALDTSLTVTVTSGTTGIFEDTTHQVRIFPTDRVSWEFISTATGGIFFFGINIIYDGLTSEVVGGLASTSASASDQFTAIIAGQMTGQLSESVAKLQFGYPTQTSNLRWSASTNTMTADVTVKVRKNGVDGNQTITITAATTGLFEDTSNTDSFTATDDIDYVMRGGTSGALTAGNTMLTVQDTDVSILIPITLQVMVSGVPPY